MKIHSQLANRLLEIPDVEGKENLFSCQNQEIARIRDGFVEVRLSHPIIRALGLANDEKTPGWVEMRCKKGSDFPAVIALVERAAQSSKIIRLYDEKDEAS